MPIHYAQGGGGGGRRRPPRKSAPKQAGAPPTGPAAPLGGEPPPPPAAEQVVVDYSAYKFAEALHVTPGTGERLPIDAQVAFGPRQPVDADAAELWDAIRVHTLQISFPEFSDFVDRALCVRGVGGGSGLSAEEQRMQGIAPTEVNRPSLNLLRAAGCGPFAPFGGFVPGTDLYNVLKLAAEMFLLMRCGVCPPTTGQTLGGVGIPPGGTRDVFNVGGGDAVDVDALSGVLADFLGNDRSSYIRTIIRNVFGDQGVVAGAFNTSPFCPLSVGFGPCLLELIWSYWHEEGMLVQTANAIALRFQNVRFGNGRDPLAELEIDPLRPLSGFLWGYIQDEPGRLSVARRAHEYSHHYGLTLYGKAVPRRSPADPRSKFLQAFHDLLRMTDLFYREASDNTVTPDPFPLLIALRDLHLILAEGAHNQFRDLPWTARSEMLVQQWLLARTEMRDFLRGRLMVPYPEAWMGAVDAMKRLQGWTDTNVIHFHDLAVFGERLLLSVRYVGWSVITDPQAAFDWALFWRPEVQGYIHAYRMSTGVNLTDEVVELGRPSDARYLQPSFHLQNRLRALQAQRR